MILTKRNDKNLSYDMKLITLGNLKKFSSFNFYIACSLKVMSPFVVKAFVLFLHSYKEEKHMRLATI